MRQSDGVELTFYKIIVTANAKMAKMHDYLPDA